MPDPVVLKKYSNRRLYDTHQSRYVTLEDVAIMIRNGKPVQIVDASTGEDVTAFILTQIVLEAAKRKNSLLPVPVLHMIIQYGDNALVDFFDNYFHKILNNYLVTKKTFDRQFEQWLNMGLDVSKRMPEIMPNTAPMDAMMELFGFTRPDPSRTTKPTSAASPDGHDTSADPDQSTADGKT
jgi:polyhydroxyalkanoate synthesis repressor PhaR